MSDYLPDDPSNPAEAIDRRRRERDAIELARHWVSVDPFYESTPLSDREQALMMLVLRCYTHPTLTEVNLVKLELAQVDQEIPR